MMIDSAIGITTVRCEQSEWARPSEWANYYLKNVLPRKVATGCINYGSSLRETAVSGWDTSKSHTVTRAVALPFHSLASSLVSDSSPPAAPLPSPGFSDHI